MVQLILFALAASALLSKARAQTHCYMPDGTIDDRGTVPCNSSAPVSACCDPRDSCTASGLCLGASGWIYRSACTDITWTSSVCPSQCHIDPILKTPYNSFAAIYPCVAGIFSTEFCCGSYAKQNGNCCGSNFTLGNTGLAFKPGTDALLAQLAAANASVSAAASRIASALTVTETVTATPNSGGSSGSGSPTNLGTAIGASIGVPLGVLALGIIGFLVWRERRRHRDVAAGQANVNNVGWAQAYSTPQGYTPMGQQQQYGGAPSVHPSGAPGEQSVGASGWKAPQPVSLHEMRG